MLERGQLLRIKLVRALVRMHASHIGHLVGRSRVRHMARLDGALGGRGLRERGTGGERKRRKTNHEPVARHFGGPLPVAITPRLDLLAPGKTGTWHVRCGAQYSASLAPVNIYAGTQPRPSVSAARNEMQHSRSPQLSVGHDAYLGSPLGRTLWPRRRHVGHSAKSTVWPSHAGEAGSGVGTAASAPTELRPAPR